MHKELTVSLTPNGAHTHEHSRRPFAAGKSQQSHLRIRVLVIYTGSLLPFLYQVGYGREPEREVSPSQEPTTVD